MSFEKINGTEPVTEKQLQSLINAMGSVAAPIFLELCHVDLAAGRGILKGNDRCLWTKDGKRITICLTSDGGVIGSISREIDPDKPEVKK